MPPGDHGSRAKTTPPPARLPSRRRTATLRRGFTLPELALGLVVLGILLALALPALGRTERRLATLVAVRTLGADLARARQRAIQERSTVRVAIDTLGGAYEVRTGSDEPVTRRSLRHDLTIRTTAYRQEILFSARGTSNLYSTTWITPRDDPRVRAHQIRVLPTGAIEAL